MPAQKITNFQGIVPRTAERLLPDMAAQVAENVNLTSGEIRPTRPAFQVYIPLVVGEKQTAYRAWSATRCIRINIGWKLWGFKEGEAINCQLTFSPNPLMGYAK